MSNWIFLVRVTFFFFLSAQNMNTRACSYQYFPYRTVTSWWYVSWHSHAARQWDGTGNWWKGL
jgi:hypothetical protein